MSKAKTDDEHLSQFSQNFPSFAKQFKSGYDAVKGLKTQTSTAEEIVKNHTDVLAKTNILSRLYLDNKPNPDLRRCLTNFVAKVGFPAVVASICTKLRKHTKDKCYTWDREVKPKEAKAAEISSAQDLINTLVLACINFSDLNDQFCFAARDGGLIPVLVDMLTLMRDCTQQMVKYLDANTQGVKQYTVRGKTLSRALGCVHNISKRMECRPACIKAGSMKALTPYMGDKVPVYSAKALLALAYLIDDENNNAIMATAGPIQFLISLTDKATKSSDRRYLGFSTSELAEGLAQIAVNDNNKKLIGAKGAIPVLVYMIKTAKNNDEEKLNAALALWTLAFDSKNRDIIAADSNALSLLKTLSQSSNKKVKKAASGALWEIEGKKKKQKEDKEKAAAKSKQAAAPSTEHVMISYQWDVQSTMIDVKNHLQSKGYKVWMDVDQMEGSTLEAMAKAVENSAVVLMCVSRKYKESVNCRSEAEYAFTQHKQIVPLMVEKGYRADGWLGMIMGSKLWFDFSSGTNIRDSADKLMKEIGSRGKGGGVVKASADVVDAAPSRKQQDVTKWDVAKVTQWLSQIGLDEHKGMIKANNVDGKKLKKLSALTHENATNYLKQDLGMDGLDAATFAQQLKQLTG